MWPLTTQAQDFSNISKSPEQIMSQLKKRLNLTKDQETKVPPIIQESIKKCNEIIQNGAQDGKKEEEPIAGTWVVYQYAIREYPDRTADERLPRIPGRTE